MPAMAVGLASLHHARGMPLAIKGREEVGDHVAMEIDLQGALVEHARAVGSRVACPADGFEGAADEAVRDFRCRVQRTVRGSFAVAHGDLGTVVNLMRTVRRM